MNSAYGAWGDYGGPFKPGTTKQQPFQSAGAGFWTGGTPGTGIRVFNPGPSTQAALTAAANGQPSAAAAAPSLADILAGIGAMLAPRTVVDTQVAEAQTAAADGSPRKPWLLIGAGVAGVVLVGGVAYFMLRKRRR